MSKVSDKALEATLTSLRSAFDNVQKNADPHTAWPASTSVKDNWNKFQLLDVYLSQVCIKKEPYKEGAQMWFVGAGTFRKYTVLPSGEVDTVYVDLEDRISKLAPKEWTSGPFTGIKAGDTVNGRRVVFVHGTDFYVWNGKGFTSCPVTAANIASYSAFFFPKDWSEDDFKEDPMLTILSVAVGDRINGRPVVQISQDGHGSVSQTRAVCSAGLDGFVFYEFDQMDNFVRVTLKQSATGTPSSTTLKSA